MVGFWRERRREAVFSSRPRPAVAPVGGPRWYAPFCLWGTVLLGGIGLVLGPLIHSAGIGWGWLPVLMALALLAEFMTVSYFESERQRMSLSFTVAVVMASATLAPALAPLVAVSAALVHVVQLRQWRRGIGRVLFNIANPALSAMVAVSCAQLLGVGLGGWQAVLAIASAAVGYYLTNTGIIAINIAAHTGQSLPEIVRGSLWSAPTTILIGMIGGFVGWAYGELGLIGTALFILPLLVLRFTLSYAARKNREAIAKLETAKEEVERAHAEKAQTLQQMIATVAAIIDARDQAVAGHSQRVAKYARAFGEDLGLDSAALSEIETAGLLHDLGKVAIPEAILHKPAKLTAEEYTIVKEHAATGERILAQVQQLLAVSRMVGDHHERFDGRGYPNGEAGEAITLGGRILAVADMLDSILSDRPYSAGRPLSWALEEAARCAGTHFDPAVVAALQHVAASRGPDFFRVEKNVLATPDPLLDPLTLFALIAAPPQASPATLAAK